MRKKILVQCFKDLRLIFLCCMVCISDITLNTLCAYKPNRLRWHGFLKLNRVRSEMVASGSGQGLSVFETAGIVDLFRGLQKSENAALGQKMPFPDGQ
jgi:hypothetical protein